MSARELSEGHLYKPMAGNYGGRKYLIHRIEGDTVIATEGWFEYTVNRDRGSPEDVWRWSPEGEAEYPPAHFESATDVGRIPDVDEPRFRFKWAMEELRSWR